MHGVLMIANGVSCYEIAKILGHSPRTIEYWINSFNSDGF
ncbi:MAG: helix-turn-helix domain-containing protein [Thermoplasmata archaeon]